MSLARGLVSHVGGRGWGGALWEGLQPPPTVPQAPWGKGWVSPCYRCAGGGWFFSGIQVFPFGLLVKLKINSLGVLTKCRNMNLYINLGLSSWSVCFSDTFSFNNAALHSLHPIFLFLECLGDSTIEATWTWSFLLGKILNDLFHLFHGYVMTQVFSSFISQFW